MVFIAQLSMWGSWIGEQPAAPVPHPSEAKNNNSNNLKSNVITEAQNPRLILSTECIETDVKSQVAKKNQKAQC